MSRRLSDTPTKPLDLDLGGQILDALDAELATVLNAAGGWSKVHGSKIGGIDIRARNRLVKEAGFQYGQALHAAWKIREQHRKAWD